MSNTTKSDLKAELNDIKGHDSTDNEVSYYEHPDSGELYNRFKEQIDDPTGIVILHRWYMAPFVVERTKAKAEGWNIVQPVEIDQEPHTQKDFVEVSEWCINPWVNNPDDRTVISE